MMPNASSVFQVGRWVVSSIAGLGAVNLPWDHSRRPTAAWINEEVASIPRNIYRVTKASAEDLLRRSLPGRIADYPAFSLLVKRTGDRNHSYANTVPVSLGTGVPY